MKITESLNIKKHCNQYRVGLWECPQFLFVLMGLVICATILATYILGPRFYDEPEITALVSLISTAILFIIGHIIVSAFERVAKASRAKSEFISIMSHELRSPLSAIKWQIDVLLSDKTSSITTSSVTMKYLETIDEQNERMIGAVNDLLEVNRIEDRDLVLRPTLFSLKDLTQRVVTKNKKYAISNNVQINIDVKSDDNFVFADEDRVVICHDTPSLSQLSANYALGQLYQAGRCSSAYAAAQLLLYCFCCFFLISRVT